MAKTNSLLDRAKAINSHKSRDHNYTEEHQTLALAWVDNEVTITQVSKVLGHTFVGSAYPFLANCLKQILNDTRNKR